MMTAKLCIVMVTLIIATLAGQAVNSQHIGNMVDDAYFDIIVLIYAYVSFRRTYGTL